MSLENRRPVLKQVGQSPPIGDAAAKAKGRLCYITDRDPDRAAHLYLILSPKPHAKILKIDASRVAGHGYIKLFSGFNLPEIKFNAAKWFSDQAGIEDQCLFPKTARYVGEAIAAVAAETRAGARCAAAQVKVIYEPLEFVVEPEDALAKPGLVQTGSAPSPLEFSSGDQKTRRAAFEQAAAVVKDTVVTPKLHHAAMENHAAQAEPNGRGGVTVFSPCQNLHAVHLIVAQVCQLPLSQVRIIKTHMGGSFGGKQEIGFEPLVAVAALDLNRPVFLELSRRQSIISTRTRTKTVGRVRTAVNEQGLITARETEVIVDAGAYTSNAEMIGRAMGKKAFRLYRIPNQRYIARIVHTNTPLSGAMRGYGSPQIHAITEINLDHAARQLNLDPCQFRLRNLVRAFDPDPSGGPDLGNARIVDCLRRGAEEFGWAQRWAQEPGTGRFRTGVGLACGTHGNGYFGSYPDFGTMSFRILADGSINLNACLHELGHGVMTIMKQIVAEVMEVQPESVTIPEPDTDFSPYDTGCQASRVTFVCGAAAMRIAQDLKKMFVREAALILGGLPERIAMQDGQIWDLDKPKQKYGYGRMASLIQKRSRVELSQTLFYQAEANPGSYAANFVDLEVDSLTGVIRVKEVLAVHDVGRAINPRLVKGQIRGGIQMGLGMALTEDLAVDPGTGRARGNDFSRYHLVNAPDMPPVKVILIEEGEEQGPFGAKSVGELAAVPIVPAVVNAVNHALGTRLSDLPLIPEKIVEALDRQKGTADPYNSFGHNSPLANKNTVREK